MVETSLKTAMQWSETYSSAAPYVIGVLEGEGIGPEVIRASLLIIDIIEQCTDYRFDIRYGGKIGLASLQESGAVLTPEVVDFCSSIFAKRGAIFCGPGGGRFVYELRKQFDLYCKFVPIQPLSSLKSVSVLKASSIENVDILVIRENVGGLYQGEFGVEEKDGYARAYHRFYYDEHQIRRILRVAILAAKQRRKKLCVITKPGGAPSISELWNRCAQALTADQDIELSMLEVDNAAYKIIADAKNFDVVVAPNMFGDIIADEAALLLGSRGMSYSANFGEQGRAVYQTGHGAAYDIMGQDRANPLGQMFSLAMMLRESFGLASLSRLLEESIEAVLSRGFRTADIMEPACTRLGTHAFAERIGDHLRQRLLKSPRPALLLIDMQNDFLDRLGSSTFDLVAKATTLLIFCRQQNIPVLHVHTQTDPAGSNRMPHWVENNYYACTAGTKGALPPDSLAAHDDEPVIYKQFYNAFNNSNLQDSLRVLDVDTLIVAGLYLHACVRTTATEAYERGYKVWIAEDAVDTTEPLHAELSRSWLCERGINFLCVKDIKRKLGKEKSDSKQEQRFPVANINNHWLHSEESNHTVINHNPANSTEILSCVPVATASMVAKACHAGKQAWFNWRKVPASGRCAFLLKWEEVLNQRLPEFVSLLVNEIGKPLCDAREEMQRTLSHLRHTFSLLDEGVDDINKRPVRLRHCPAGCYAIITPWNNPIAIPVSKIAPALLFGNTVIWKPAPQAPLLSQALMNSLLEAGLVEGSVNLLFGDETTGRALIADTHINAVSLTGSVHAGKSVSTMCGRLGKTLQAELGGNNACIILADIDLEEAVDHLALSAFSFAGQRCTSTRRFIVQESIARDFEILFAKAIISLRLGDPANVDTQVGPVISEAHLLKIQTSINHALAEGARIVCGGRAPIDLKDGYWWEPTLLAEVEENSSIVQRETFGPVALIQTATDIKHAVHLANSVPHGLLASLLTHDLAAKIYFEEHIEAGILKLAPGPLMVQADVPFGGWKASQNGPPEHGEWDRLFYTRPQSIYG